MSKESMVLQGKNIGYVRSQVPVGQCLLDPSNPRIQYLVGQRAGIVNESELGEIIWEKDAVKALADSIFLNGGVYEHVIVQKQKDGLFLVREGNCRTVACRHLIEQYPGDARFSTMPAMVFDGDLSAEDLAVLLADMHVAGKIQWDAYEQAKHVAELFNVYGKTYDWLSSHLRMSKSKIQELLSAYRATTEFLTLHPAAGNVKKFTLFHELVKRKALRDRFNEDPEFKQQFHRWLVDNKVTDHRQVKDLPKIMESPEAMKALEVTGFREAQNVLVRNDPTLESDLFHAVKVATDRLKEAPVSDVQGLKSNPQKLIILRNLKRAMEDLATLAEVSL